MSASETVRELAAAAPGVRRVAVIDAGGTVTRYGAPADDDGGQLLARAVDGLWRAAETALAAHAGTLGDGERHAGLEDVVVGLEGADVVAFEAGGGRIVALTTPGSAGLALFDLRLWAADADARGGANEADTTSGRDAVGSEGTR